MCPREAGKSPRAVHRQVAGPAYRVEEDPPPLCLARAFVTGLDANIPISGTPEGTRIHGRSATLWLPNRSDF